MVYTICALCVGVASATLFQSLQEIPTMLLVLVVFFGAFILLFFAILWRRIILMLFFGIVATLGIIITNMAFSHIQDLQDTLREFINKTVVVQGSIAREPDIREGKQFLVIKTTSIDSVSITTHLRITTHRHHAYTYNDFITFEGQLRKPEAFETESGRVFRYDNYLMNQRILGTMFQPSVIDHTQGKQSLVGILLHIKSWFLDRIERILPHPEAGLLEGLLLGVRAIPDALYDDFRRTGIVHIVVLSGYNVMLVANFVASILKRRARWIQFVGVFSSLLAFMIITGMQTTVIRATIMGGIAAMGRIMGAEYSITKSLSIAAGIMIIINPLTLMYDISFQLSFLATIGLVYVGPMIEPFFQWVPERFEVRENLVATLATSVFVMPLIAYSIGDLSIVSPLTNLLVLPFVAPAMALGFVMALASIAGPLAWLSALPTYICLWIIINMAILLGSLPWASVVLPVIPVWGLVGMYGVLFAGVILYEKKT